MINKLPKYPKGWEEFMQDTLRTANENDIKLKFSESKFLRATKDDNSPSSGFFSSETMTLACSTKAKHWLELFVHESCHMQQYLFDRYNWDKRESQYNYFFSWLEGILELSKREIRDCTNGVIWLERDCEKRSVEMIDKYQLPVNKIEYIKRANSYLYGICYMSTKREWINKLYEHKKIWNLAPSKFQRSYHTIPQKLYEAFESISR